MIRHDERSRGRRGSALLAVVAMTVTIAMLSAIMLQQSISHLQSQSGSVDKKQALYLAEAGLAEGLYALRSGASGNVGSPEAPAAYGDGAYLVETTEDANGLLTIRATGIAGGARATLENVVEPVIGEASAVGLAGFSQVLIEQGATIQPYTSDAAALAEIIEQLASDEVKEALASTGTTAADLSAARAVKVATLGATELDLPLQLTVASNGSIKVAGTSRVPTAINGSVTPGPDGEVALGLGVTVSGSTSPRTTKLVPPEIELPKVTVEPAYTLATGRTATVGPDERGFSTISVEAGSTLRIVGPTTVLTRALTVARGATLEIDSSGGPVEIYAANGVKFAAGSTLDNTYEDPNGLSLFVAGDTEVDLDRDGSVDPVVTLPTTGDLHLELVAPSTTVQIPAGTNFFGNAVADTLWIGEGANFYFDNSLLVGAEQDAALEIISWQVMEVPEVLARDLRTNLVRELEVANGGTLPSPADATRPIEYAVEYQNDEGQDVIYRGTAADFAAKDDGDTLDDVSIIKRILNPASADDEKIMKRRRTLVGKVKE